ncbi:hypothetical protein [Halpernia frigidisoli]|uniref:Uncharacterized protein n=1 Tax=Halpernia frigidisoli TaxID=1125876 RepID=A0A1I3FSQ3_9FLAO|nr:hypothetical protein [Halpernia frigidisoli]SFI14263.1 hypothetical protein SAMN05443292_1607 [Halpernia frigidisoli]
MKKFFKIFVIIIAIIIIVITSLYFILFTKIEFQEKIASSKEIKNLDNKIFWDLGYYKPEKISTDFSLGKKKNDTVCHDFSVSQNKNHSQIGYFRLSQSNGFGGNVIQIYKLGNRFRIEMEDVSDNVIENTSKKGYKILSQKLILDKKNYNIKDSIFGEIKIKFRNNEDNSINYGSGFFRTTVN